MIDPISYLDGRVSVHGGDCMAVVRTLADNSIDACVTDPPYALVSIGKRFGADGARLPNGGDENANVYNRTARGFMGKAWDTGETAFAVEFWREILRVLKPGGHVCAFGGTRSYHRLACAIEDAGFEIRDQLAWMYGTGFPKSHDVSKGIDRNHRAGEIGWFGKWLREERVTRGITQKDLAERGGFFDKINRGGMVANWELGYGIPSAKDFNKVCEILSVGFPPIEEFEREVIGRRKVGKGVAFASEGAPEVDITFPASEAARTWGGWGTALKPAWEPICLARKPLSESTVAANVLRWGTGAINIDATRVGDFDHDAYVETLSAPYDRDGEASAARRYTSEGSTNFAATPGPRGGSPKGRWPANIITDGSEDVISAFPDSDGQLVRARTDGGEMNNGVYGALKHITTNPYPRGDSGSAARFFFSAKADSDDRLGSKHPTVKPLDLMQWLCRLICPPGGKILDPFAGTGTTGEAARREGFSAILIEREPEYLADIARRMKYATEGPMTRGVVVAKARARGPEDHGPLFACHGAPRPKS